MNALRAVLFDFDGTLTLPGSLDFTEIKNAMQCPPDVPVLEYMESLGSGEEKDRAVRILESFEDRAAQVSRPNEGTEDLIVRLRSARMRVGILTRNSLRSVRRSLDNFSRIRLADFDVVIARGDVARPKPDPEGVVSAAQRLGLCPSEMMVVGDYIYDIQAGRKAGAFTVFLDNHGTATKYPDPPADYTIRALTELNAIVLPLSDGTIE